MKKVFQSLSDLCQIHDSLGRYHADKFSKLLQDQTLSMKIIKKSTFEDLRKALELFPLILSKVLSQVIYNHEVFKIIAPTTCQLDEMLRHDKLKDKITRVILDSDDLFDHFFQDLDDVFNIKQWSLKEKVAFAQKLIDTNDGSRLKTCAYKILWAAKLINSPTSYVSNFFPDAEECRDFFSKCLNLLIRKISSDELALNTIFTDKALFILLCKSFPQYKTSLISLLRQHPGSFRCLVNYRDDYFGLCQEFPDFSETFTNLYTRDFPCDPLPAALYEGNGLGV